MGQKTGRIAETAAPGDERLTDVTPPETFG
jgi:hypothetical protein